MGLAICTSIVTGSGGPAALEGRHGELPAEVGLSSVARNFASEWPLTFLAHAGDSRAGAQKQKRLKQEPTAHSHLLPNKNNKRSLLSASYATSFQ